MNQLGPLFFVPKIQCKMLIIVGSYGVQVKGIFHNLTFMFFRFNHFSIWLTKQDIIFI